MRYTIKIRKTSGGWNVTIIDNQTKKGIAIPNMGDTMVEFINQLVTLANTSGVEDFQRMTDEVVLIDGKHYRIMTDAETVEFIWTPDNILPEPQVEAYPGLKAEKGIVYPSGSFLMERLAGANLTPQDVMGDTLVGDVQPHTDEKKNEDGGEVI